MHVLFKTMDHCLFIAFDCNFPCIGRLEKLQLKIISQVCSNVFNKICINKTSMPKYKLFNI